MEDSLSFATDSAERVQALVVKAKAALSTLFGLVLPKLPQEKTLDELAETFLIKEPNSIEVLKRTSRIYGALLAFQLLMGYNIEADFETMSKALPTGEDGVNIDLTQFTRRARECARQLVELVEANKKKGADKDAPSASGQTNLP